MCCAQLPCFAMDVIYSMPSPIFDVIFLVLIIPPNHNIYIFSQTDYVFCPVYEIPFAQPWGSREELKQGKHVWVDCKEGLEGAELLRWSGFLFLEVSTEPIALSENKIAIFFYEKSIGYHHFFPFHGHDAMTDVQGLNASPQFRHSPKEQPRRWPVGCRVTS